MVFNKFSVKVSLNDVSTLLKAFKILRYHKQGQCESHFVYGIKYKIKYTQQMGQYRLRDNAGAGGGEIISVVSITCPPVRLYIRPLMSSRSRFKSRLDWVSPSLLIILSFPKESLSTDSI